MVKSSVPSIAPMLLRPREAATALGISVRHLWDLARAGEIPVVRLGRNTRYDPADLERLIESRKRSHDA